MKIILDDLKSKLPVDAVQLSLHGAMATRDVPRPEAEIAKRVKLYSESNISSELDVELKVRN